MGVDGRSSQDNQHEDGVITVLVLTTLGSLLKTDEEEETADGEEKLVLFMLN